VSAVKNLSQKVCLHETIFSPRAPAIKSLYIVRKI